ncbi:MAG: leucine-rich repeat domain-containing protein [Tissierellales bacterium]|nr:leucine-rich repeat domain-containing protein [Tissierellales bacterium]
MRSQRKIPFQKDSQWDIFICHASEDKEEIARPLAEALRRNGLKVWYDDFTLSPGDSLNRSINKGLKNSTYGIVILSPNFFAKEWPQRELDGLSARETLSGKVIVPIWHKINHEEVEHFSPILADKLAIPSNKGIEFIIQRILTLFPQGNKEIQDQKGRKNVQKASQDSDSKHQRKETEKGVNQTEYKIQKKDLISVDDLFQDLEEEELKRNQLLEQQKAQEEYERVRRLEEEKAKRKIAEEEERQRSVEEEKERIRRLQEEEAKRKIAEEETKRIRQISEAIENLSDNDIVKIAEQLELNVKDRSTNMLQTQARRQLSERLMERSTLEFTKLNITSFSFITGLQRLTDLTLNKGNIKDFAPLKSLSQLQKLELKEIQIDDLSFLEGLTNMQVLKLIRTGIKNISPLRSLFQLRELDLALNDITDIRPLNVLKQLTKLNVTFTVIWELSSLEGLTKLKELNLSRTRIKNISSLAKLGQLEVLDISNNTQIQDFTPLAKLGQLEVLDISNNTQIQDFTPLKNLSKLRILNVSDSNIRDISPLTNLRHLKELTIRRINKIQNLQLLHEKNFPNLEKLMIDCTPKQMEELKKALPQCTIYRENKTG